MAVSKPARGQVSTIPSCDDESENVYMYRSGYRSFTPSPSCTTAEVSGRQDGYGHNGFLQRQDDEEAHPYTRDQLIAIYAANANLLTNSPSQDSFHMFPSEGEAADMDNYRFAKFSGDLDSDPLGGSIDSIPSYVDSQYKFNHYASSGAIYPLNYRLRSKVSELTLPPYRTEKAPPPYGNELLPPIRPVNPTEMRKDSQSSDSDSSEYPALNPALTSYGPRPISPQPSLPTTNSSSSLDNPTFQSPLYNQRCKTAEDDIRDEHLSSVSQIGMYNESNIGQSVTFGQGYRQDLKYAGTAYERAVKKGECAANQFKLVMLGPHGAGKTSTVRSLLGKQFQPDQPSTVGADISYVLTSDTVDCIYTCDWEMNEFHEYMEELTTRCDHELKLKMIEILRKTQNLSENVAYNSTGLKVLHNEAKPKGKTRIIIYDLGGQEIYYDIQFLFLASHDVIFLTFNASIDLDEPLVTQQCYENFQKDYKVGKTQTNFQAIEATLHAVHSFCGERCNSSISPCIPIVIMVATHASGLTEEKKMKITDTIIERLVNTPLINHFPRKDLIDPIYFIDNRGMKPETLKKLKNVALLAAEFALTKKQPISYLKFEQEILKMARKKAWISKEKTSRIAATAGVEDSHESLEELLQHCTCKGILLHYSKSPTLGDLVFISPQAVSNLVSFVIKTHDYAKFSHTFELRKKFIRFDKFGLLEEALLDDMLRRSKNSNYTKKLILDFLITFYLAVEVNRWTKFENEEESFPTPDSGCVFIVPSVLVYNKSKDYLKPENHVNNVILYHFPDKFLPTIVFNYVLTLTIRWCAEKGHSIHCVHRGIGVFDFSNEKQCFALQHCPKSHSIKCHICVHTQEVNDASLSVQRLELVNELGKLIDLVHKRCISKSQKPIAYLECPLQHDEMCGPHLSLDKIKPNMYCTKDYPKRKVPEEAYNLVLPLDHPGKYDERFVKVTCAVVLCPITERYKRPTHKELGRCVIHQFATLWSYIGTELGVPIANIEYDNHNCVVCFRKTLETWLELNPLASWKMLEVAITNVIRAKNGLESVDDIYGSEQQRTLQYQNDRYKGHIVNQFSANPVPGNNRGMQSYHQFSSSSPTVTGQNVLDSHFCHFSEGSVPTYDRNMQRHGQLTMHRVLSPQPSSSPLSEMSHAKQALCMFKSDTTPIKRIHSYNKMISEIASNMRAEWEWLAKLLGVTEPDIRAIEMYIHPVTKQVVQMFQQWLMTNTSRATLDVLTTAVYNAGPQYWHLLNIITKYAETLHGTLV